MPNETRRITTVRFSESAVSVEDVKKWSSPTNPPVYISQVTYGRMLLLTVTSRASRTDLKAALKVHASGSVDINVTIDAGYKKIINESQIQILSKGDTGFVVSSTLVPSEGKDLSSTLVEYMRQGGKYSTKNPGAPIAFTARYLGSRRLASAALVTNFTELVAVNAPEVVGEIEIWDGTGGGPKSTDVRIGPGDAIEVTATGTNWSGVIFTGDYGPDGWVGHKAGKPFPIEGEPPFCVIAGFNNSNWFKVGSSYSGTANITQPATLWFSTNDDNPLNGDVNKKFCVRYRVARKSLSRVGVGATE